MSIPLSRARQYCTTAEVELVLWSTLKRVGELTPARLKQKIERARKLRDKYRDLASQQRREARGKNESRGKRPSQSNEATVLKQQIFSEALERFEAALAMAEAGAKRTAGESKKVTRAKARAARKAEPAESASAKPAAGSSAGARGRRRRKPAKGAKVAKVSKPVGKAASSKKRVPQRDESVKEAKEQASRLLEFTKKVFAKFTQEQVNKGGARRQHAHVSSRARRNQAKRDTRGAGG